MKKSGKLMIEVSRINVNEQQIFPYNVYDIKIWSNEHEPPHFHIIRDDWDVTFLIENGELHNIKHRGKGEQILSYMVHNAKEWLGRESVLNKGKTNQENAWITWQQENPK